MCSLKHGLSNLILTLTGQKLIDWSLNTLHVITFTFFDVFLTFFKIQKRDFLRFLALLHTFSRTMDSTSIRLQFDRASTIRRPSLRP